MLFTDHVAEAGIEDAHVLDRVVDQGVAIEIVGVRIAVVVVARVPIVRARAESPVLAANLQIGKKTVAPNQGKFYNYKSCFVKFSYKL